MAFQFTSWLNKPDLGIRGYSLRLLAFIALGATISIPLSLYSAYRNHVEGQQSSLQAKAQSLATLDADKNGEASLAELVEATLKGVLVFDKDNSGGLNPEEYRQSLGLATENGDSEETYLSAFSQADLDKDNELSAQEIKAYVTPAIAEMFSATEAALPPASPSVNK